jgi:putative transcriptional regulator
MLEFNGGNDRVWYFGLFLSGALWASKTEHDCRQSLRMEHLQLAFVVRHHAIAMKNILPQLRAERGWTQGDLAAELNVSRQTVNALETERYEPSLSLAFTIAKLFEQPIEAIFRPSRR